MRLVILASLTLAFVAESEAKACSCMQQVFGGGRLYVGANGALPADALGFPWTGPEPLAGSKGRVTVVRVDGKKKVPVKHTIEAKGPLEIIVPAAKFKPGQVYEVTVRESEAAAKQRKELGANAPTDLPPAEVTTTVTIGAEPLKLAQATLQAGTPEQKGLAVAHGASCQAEIRASAATVKVELPPEAEPLRDYLVYETRVDGQPWKQIKNLCTPVEPGRTWAGTAGEDVVFATCEQGEAAGEYPKPGKHKVEVEVASPDRAVVITTPAVELDFACAAPEPPPSEEPPPSSAPPASEEPPPVAKKGCSVGDPGFAGVLGLAGLLAWRRRRRAS